MLLKRFLRRTIGTGICALVASLFIVTAPAWASIPEVIYDSGGFEAFSLGALNGQFGWIGAGNPGELEPQIVEPTTSNKAAMLLSSDASDTGSAMFIGFGADLAQLYTNVTVKFDIFRNAQGPIDPQTMLWLWVDGPDPSAGVQADDGYTYPLVGSSGFLQAETVFDRYATLELQWDLVNGTAMGWYDNQFLGSLAIVSTQTMSIFGMGLANLVAGTPDATGADFALIDNFSVTGIPVPEPASVLLIGTGMAATLALRRRLRKRNA